MRVKKDFKAINFDLDTKKLSAYYKRPSSAYKKLERDLNKLGFTHRQWSGYISKTKISSFEIMQKIDTLAQNNPWLANVVNRFDVTVVENQFDMKTVIRRASAKQQNTLTNGSTIIHDSQNVNAGTPKETFSFGAHKGKKSGRSPEKER